MTKSPKVFFIGAAIVALMVAGLTLFVLINGKGLLLAQIEKGLGVKAEASSIRIVFPSSIVAEELTIGESIRCRRLKVTPSLLSFLKGDILLNAVVIEEPVVDITRYPDGTFDFGIPLPSDKPIETASVQETTPSPAKKKVRKSLNFYVENAKIANGTIVFTDKGTADNAPFTGKITRLQAQAGRASFLQLTRMRFEITGQMENEIGGVAARLKSSGWVDPLAKDMDAQVLVTDADLTAFKSYYMKFFKKELVSGLMMLSADLKSEKNDLTVDAHMEIGNIVFIKQPSVDATSSEAQVRAAVQDLGAMAFQAVLSSEGKISFNFIVRTKLDRPRFENFRLKGNFFQKNAEGLLGGPSEEQSRKFKEIGKQFKDIGKQLKDAFTNKEP